MKEAASKKASRMASVKMELKRHRWLYVMILPGVLYMLIFSYLPMGGLVMAFQDFSPYNGDSAIGAILGSSFVGLDVFKTFLTGPDFMRLLKNTLSISITSLIFFFPAPITWRCF